MFSFWNILLLLSSLVLSIQSEGFAERYHNQVASVMKKDEIKEVETKTNLNFKSSIGDAHEYIKKLYETFYRTSDSRGIPGGKMPHIVHSYIGNLTGKSNVVYFNLSGDHAEESIVKAEIRLKLSNNPVHWRRGSHSRVLTLYDVTTQKQASHAVHLDANQQWAVFPFRSLVKRWLRFPQTNRGVQLVLKNGKTDQLESPNRVIIRERGSDARQPLPQLVIFADRKSHQLSTAAFKRTRRSCETDPEMEGMNSSSAQNKIRDCFRRASYVTAKGLFGLNVIAPDGYDAYTCEGTCAERPNNDEDVLDPDHNPLGQGMNMQCVPASYSSMSVLYADARDHVYLLTVPNMIVSECKCSYIDNSSEAAQ